MKDVPRRLRLSDRPCRAPSSYTDERKTMDQMAGYEINLESRATEDEAPGTIEIRMLDKIETIENKCMCG
ncbi:hypothetical protein [Streptomyces sp. NPDC000229]|uniref:hypothetical protein n=1 Tax=Streptomyces sp. NPDC000229 TaxID=3154247 RepID=UPI003316DEE1